MFCIRNLDEYLPLVNQNAQLVVRPRESINVSLQTSSENSLFDCKFTLPSNDTVTITKKEYTVNRLSFSVGSGRIFPDRALSRINPYDREFVHLARCDFTIKNVQEEDSGVFFILAHGARKSIGAKAVTLIVTSE